MRTTNGKRAAGLMSDASIPSSQQVFFGTANFELAGRQLSRNEVLANSKLILLKYLKA